MKNLEAGSTHWRDREMPRRRTIRRQVMIFMIVLLTCICPISAYAASLTLNRQQLVLYTGQHAALTVNGKKKTQSVRWSSGDKKTAKVDQKGNVTAVRKGKTKIIARVGKKQLTCRVIVKKDPVPKTVEKARTVAAGTFSYTDRPGRTLIYTGIPRLDYLTEALVREMGINGSWSDEQILKRIYSYMSRYFYYLKDRHYMDTLPVYYDADLLGDRIAAFEQVTKRAAAQGKIRFTDKFTGVMSLISFSSETPAPGESIRIDDISAHIETHEGVCDNHADVFSVLCAHLGIESGIVGGTVSGNSHSWSWAKLNGKKYYFDIGSAIHSFHHKRKVTMGYFKMKRKNMKKYRFRTIL